jgi:adenosine/AMP kinase
MNNKINNKGKMVYCQETFQLFPSAKTAAEAHGMKVNVMYENLNNRTKTAKGKHFVYIENVADLSSFFATKRREAKEKEAMRKAAEERVIKLEAEQKELTKKLAEARKIARRV